MIAKLLFTAVSLLLGIVGASAMSLESQPTAALLYQFSNGTWIENIAARANGNLLVTLIDRPELYEINPLRPSQPKLIHHFSAYSSLLGITEVHPDVFAIIAGNLTLRGVTEPGSFAVWKVVLHRAGRATASKIADIPDALFPNGMTTLDSASGNVLFSDSSRGVVFRMDTHTGKHSVVLDDASFKPPATAPQPLGINGIRRSGKYLYYGNTLNPLFGRVSIDQISGTATGPFEVLAKGIVVDDFAIAGNTAFLAGNPTNVVTEVKMNGDWKVIVGNLNSTVVAGATSAAFGRTSRDRNTLYVVTSGAQAGPVNGTYTEGGKVVAVRICPAEEWLPDLKSQVADP